MSGAGLGFAKDRGHLKGLLAAHGILPARLISRKVSRCDGDVEGVALGFEEFGQRKMLVCRNDEFRFKLQRFDTEKGRCFIAFLGREYRGIGSKKSVLCVPHSYTF